MITSIILKELIDTETFSFKYFYERRIRRILPALLSVMLVSFLFAWMYLLPTNLVDFSKSVIYSLGFGSNFYFHYSGQIYGAESGLLKPLLHTWSLSVEEQFYIIFPLILLISFTYLRKYLFFILISGIIMSLGLADWGSKNYTSATFYFLHSRIWELLFGSVLSYLEAITGEKYKNKILSLILPTVGLVLILATIIFFKLHFNHPSLYTLPGILGTCLIIWFSNKDEITYKILSSRLFVGIGLISYSLYLWHYPIFSFLRIIQLEITGFLNNFIVFLIIFIISFISYRFIEKPFRNKNYKFSYIFLIIFLFFFVLIALSLNTISKDGISKKLPAILKKDLTDKPWELLKDDYDKRCHGKKGGCDFNKDSNKKIFLIGDSHVATLMFDLKNRLVHKNYRFITSTNDGCVYLPGFNRLDRKTESVNSICNNEYFSKLKERLLKENNSVMIFGGLFPLYLNDYFLFDNKEGGGKKEKWMHGKFAPLNKDDSIESVFKKEILELSKKNRIILIYPIPETGWNIPQKIYAQWIKRNRKSNKEFSLENINTSYQVYKDRTSSTYKLFDTINSENIFRVYPSSLFCNTLIQERCITHNNDDIFYSDNNHPSTKGAEMINELILDKIKIIEISKK